MQFGMKPTDKIGKQKVGTERDLFEIWVGNTWHTFEHMPLTISLYHLVALIFCKQAVAVEIACTTIHEKPPVGSGCLLNYFLGRESKRTAVLVVGKDIIHTCPIELSPPGQYQTPPTTRSVMTRGRNADFIARSL